jgi:hypothetical protein
LHHYPNAAFPTETQIMLKVMARLCEGHRWQAPKQVLGFGISIHFVWMAVFLVNESAMEARNKN